MLVYSPLMDHPRHRGQRNAAGQCTWRTQQVVCGHRQGGLELLHLLLSLMGNGSLETINYGDLMILMGIYGDFSLDVIRFS